MATGTGPFVEVQIHNPVLFEQDVEFMVVPTTELQQPGVMELVEAFARRYRVAVKSVDSDGVLSPVCLNASASPRANLDAARRQQEQTSLATVVPRRTRLFSAVANVPSHWSMVKPGIRHVDVTANRWKERSMRDHFQRLVDVSIDQARP